MILDGMDDEMSQGSLVGSIASRYTHKLNPKEGNSAQKYMFTFRQRRQHFKRKLEMLDQTIKELTEEKYNIDKNRTILTLGMREMEGKHMVFKLEIERLKQYRGENITSSILHGSNMQYKTADYKRRINNAYEECIRDITNAKFCMIEGEDRRHQIRELLEKKEEEKKERQAKFLEFDLAFQRKAKLMHRIGAVSGKLVHCTVSSLRTIVLLFYYCINLSVHTED